MTDPPSSSPEAPVRRVVVGTAGHVDHGKTRLVEALTGIDCDRWAEEKERGITIDLGFAHRRVELGDGSVLQLGFVDVPGHERFLRNALAGLGGIRVVLLVVAADEGVEPQTLEHLAVCSLLDIPAAVVALTKVDLVDPDLAGLARLEIEELLETTPFAGAPVLPVSSRTGEGIEALGETLVEVAARHAVEPSLARPARLPLDRAFSLKGLGAVVTGTLAQGTVALGDSLDILPPASPGEAPPRARVRGLQVHGEERERAVAGERVALQLAGVDLDDLERGRQAVTPEAFVSTDRLLVASRLLEDSPLALEGLTPVKVHLLSSERMARARPVAAEGAAVLGPGDSGPVELRLAEPVVAVRGDRVILRRPSPEATLGGGVVLDPVPAARRGADLAEAARELALPISGREETGRGGEADRHGGALLRWAADARLAGLEAVEAARWLGEREETTAERLDRLAAAGRLLSVPAGPGRGRRWVAPAAYRTLTRRAPAVLEEHFAADRLSSGMARAEAVERLLPGPAAALADVYLEWLVAQQILAVDGGRITLPGRSPRLTDEESDLARRVVERYGTAGLTPPAPVEVARELGAKPQILDGLVRYLVDRERLARLPGGLVIARRAVDRLVADLRATGWERFDVAAFKERFDLSRKWAIPLLEHLDSIGATRRVGDQRLVVGGDDRV